MNVDRSGYTEILRNQKADWLKKLFKEKFYSQLRNDCNHSVVMDYSLTSHPGRVCSLPLTQVSLGQEFGSFLEQWLVMELRESCCVHYFSNLLDQIKLELIAYEDSIA